MKIKRNEGGPMTLLKQAVEKRTNYLINELTKYEYLRTSDGRRLSELTLTELEQAHITVKCKFAKEMSQDELH